MTWLGDNNPFSESFPQSDLNEAQVRTLLGFSHKIRISGLGVSPAVKKLTESGILEVKVNWAKTMDDHGVGGTIWLKDDGQYIAAEVWEGAHFSDIGPVRVYRWRPEVRRWAFDAKAEEVVYEQSTGHKGAIRQTRDFIRNMWDQPDITAVITNQGESA